jgi:hypothetical protein
MPFQQWWKNNFLKRQGTKQSAKDENMSLQVFWRFMHWLSTVLSSELYNFCNYSGKNYCRECWDVYAKCGTQFSFGTVDFLLRILHGENTKEKKKYSGADGNWIWFFCNGVNQYYICWILCNFSNEHGRTSVWRRLQNEEPSFLFELPISFCKFCTVKIPKKTMRIVTEYDFFFFFAMWLISCNYLLNYAICTTNLKNYCVKKIEMFMQNLEPNFLFEL